MAVGSVSHPSRVRRMLLVDFDWEDADLVPELLQQPGVSIRLVVGADDADAGVRLAELCGLPRSVDLADLTREIFDLALVGERSPRRTQIEGLLLALGTPSLTPQIFVSAAPAGGDLTPGVQAPLELHAVAMETALGGRPISDIVEEALPDISDDAPTAPVPVRPAERPRFTIASLENFPSPEARRQLEASLHDLMADTGAARAEMRIDSLEPPLVVELGPEDNLLRSLVERAVGEGTPQVVSSVGGEAPGTTWGAWPFRTEHHQGVVAAGGIRAEQWSVWERTVEDLRAGCANREPAAAPTRWVTPATLTARVDAILAGATAGDREWTLLRLDFPAAPGAVDGFADALHARLRAADLTCRPSPTRIVLLGAASGAPFDALRARVLDLWSSSWRASGGAEPPPGLVEEVLALADPGDGAGVREALGRWL